MKIHFCNLARFFRRTLSALATPRNHNLAQDAEVAETVSNVINAAVDALPTIAPAQLPPMPMLSAAKGPSFQFNAAAAA